VRRREEGWESGTRTCGRFVIRQKEEKRYEREERSDAWTRKRLDSKYE